MICAAWPRLGRVLRAWLDQRRAAWARESARTWPAQGDVWVGLGERIEVRRAAVRVNGENGVDILVTNGEQVRSLWAPYAEYVRNTRGMMLVQRGGHAP